MDDKLRPPSANKGDVAYAAVRAGLSSVPVVGAAATELFALVLAPPLEKRRTEWMNSVAEELKSLADRVEGMKLEDLSSNETFVSTLMHASQIAVRNHQTEKLEALRNAVMNVAADRAPAEDIQMIFLNLIDTLTPWHIRVLRFFQSPREYVNSRPPVVNYMMGAPSTILERYYPELGGRRDFYDLLVRDLHSSGLFTMADLHVTMSAHGLFEKRTTRLGDEFVAFITSPA